MVRSPKYISPPSSASLCSGPHCLLPTIHDTSALRVYSLPPVCIPHLTDVKSSLFSKGSHEQWRNVPALTEIPSSGGKHGSTSVAH